MKRGGEKARKCGSGEDDKTRTLKIKKFIEMLDVQ
jgi:hypothetical protein